MAIMKLYGHELSENGMRIMAALHEKQLDYDDVHVDMFAGDHKKEPYLSLNPFGQVPAFEDGDLKLFESRAVTSYIAHVYANHGTPLVFADPKKMATVSVWMEVEAHQFDPPASKLSWELVLKPVLGMTTDEAAVEESEAKLGKVLDVYETRLSEFKYLAGDEFSLADLNHLPHMEYLMGTYMKKLFESRPRVDAWCKNIMGRPSWSKAVEMQEQKKHKTKAVV